MDLARVYSLALAAVENDKSLEPQEQEKLSDQYAGQAITLLKKMAEGKYFADAEHLAALKTDKDLEPLRARGEFAEFLKSIQSKPKDP